MKILFLVTDKHDYLNDVVFHGLVQLLGSENVLEYPRTPRLHEPPPPDLPYNAMHYLNLPGARDDRELEELAAEAEAVVVGSVRGAAKLALIRVLELELGKPIAIVDGWDDPYVRAAIRYCDVYLKRETLADGLRLRLRMPARRVYHAVTRRPAWRDPLLGQIAVATRSVPKLVPLPFAMIETGLSLAEEKRYDVCFVGAPTSAERVALVAELRRMRSEGYRVVVPDDPEWHLRLWHEPNRVSWSEYMKLLSACRICLNVRGVGYDTYRYWEIPYAGSLLLSEPPRTVIPDNFVDGEEAVFAPASQLCDVARQLLETDTERIAAAGRAKLLRRHMSVNRAQTVVDRLDSVRAARRGRRSRRIGAAA